MLVTKTGRDAFEMVSETVAGSAPFDDHCYNCFVFVGSFFLWGCVSMFFCGFFVFCGGFCGILFLYFFFFFFFYNLLPPVASVLMLAFFKAFINWA